MRHHFTARLAALALLVHPAVQAQTPAENAEPPKVTLSLLPGVPAPDAPTQASLTAWLLKFQKAVHQMRFQDYLEMVDWDSLIDATFSEGTVPMDDAKKLRIKKILVSANERSFPLIRQFFQFQNAEIRRVDLTGDKAVVIARIHDEEDIEYKARWWLRRQRGEKWLMTDFENISVNVRLSAVLQMGAQAAAAKEGFNSEQAVKLTEMGVAVQEGDYDKAYAFIKELEASRLPAGMTEFFLSAKISVLSQLEGKDGELEASMVALEKAAPENPVLLLMRAATSYDAGDYKNTIAWTQKIGATVGYDSDTWGMLADSFHELKQDKEYLATSEGWVADYPNSPLAVWSLWDALPPAQREGRVRPLLEKLTPAEDALTTFGGAAGLEEDVAALKLTIAVMQERKVSPEAVEDFQSQLKELIEAKKDTPRETK